MFSLVITVGIVSMQLTKARSLHGRCVHAILRPHSSSTSPHIFFVLGGPGSGKGTQCEMISNALHIPHISAGELLRNEMATDSADGKRITQCLNDGKIVPVSITLSLLRKRIKELHAPHYLIDGFPRNEDNYIGWNADMQHCVIDAVFFLDCPEEVLEKRLLSRRREDDSIESIRKRFVTYRKETLPIVEKYQREGKLRIIDANRSREEVFAAMRKQVELIVNRN